MTALLSASGVGHWGEGRILEPAKSAVPRGTVYIGMQGVVTYLVQFLSYVVLTRILTPVEIGKVPLLNAAMAVFGTVTVLSLQTATTKFVSEYAGGSRMDKASGAAWTAIRVVATVSVPAFILLAFLSPEVSELIFGSSADAGLIAFALLAALISSFGALLVSMLWGLNLFSKMVTCNLTAIVVGRTVGVLLAWVGLRLQGFVIGWVVGAAASLALSVVFARPYLRTRREHVSAGSMLAYSYPILFTVLIGLVQNWADVTILYGLTGSLVSTGVYYMGLAGAGVLSIFAGALTGAIFPTLCAMYGRGEPGPFRETLKVSQRILNVSVLPVGFALAAISGTAVTVAYGKAYLGASVPFAIIAGSWIVPVYLSLMAVTLQATAHTRPLVTIWGIAALTEVVLTAALVLPLNVIGSAVARFGMSLVGVLVAFSYVKGEWWPTIDRTSLAKGLALSAFAGVILFTFDSFAANALQVSPLSRILLEAGVFVVVYAGGLIALKPLIRQDIDLLRSALPPRFRSWLDPVEHWVTSEL
jgi:O-antigen/teichoic acid export membrane protein